MQRTLAAFGLSAALLFGVHGERAMEHAGKIQQLGAIDFADVEQKTKKLFETEDVHDLDRDFAKDEKLDVTPNTCKGDRMRGHYKCVTHCAKACDCLRGCQP